MPEMTLMPRFAETDALGHINNCTLGIWFESARLPIFQLFVPDLDTAKWNVILRRTEYDFLDQLYYGREVTIRTRVAEVRDSSMVIGQEAWQDGRLATRGTAILVHFDYGTQKKKTIPEDLRAKLLAL